MNKILTLLFVLLTCNLLSQEKPNPITLEPGAKAIDFKLKGTDNNWYSLSSFDEAKILVLVFTAPHCPTAQAYEDRLISLQKIYKSKGVQLVMINPNSPDAVCLEERGYSDLGDSFEDMQIRVKDKAYNFPFLYDGDTEETSIKYGPVATPHAFVFDHNRVLRYVGRIDNSEKIGTATQHDLKNAIDAILQGKEIEVKKTKVFGCSVKWKWKNEWKKKLDADWAKKDVKLELLSVKKLKELLKNDSKNLSVINIWATWCGPCVAEMPELVNTYRMFMGRDFEMYTISTDKPDNIEKVKAFLQEKSVAIDNNYIFESDNKYDLIENFDEEWPGQIPYTVIVEPGGKIVWRNSGGLNFLELRKAIVENKLIGRYF